ncbi:ATP-binding cassette domain-containing protein [Streptomyces sp. NPDC002067]
MNILELENVTQSYGSRIAVNRISLSLGIGAFGLLGPNGAGKTTLLRTMATRITPKKGTVTFRGTPLHGRKELRAARRDIGFLPQSFDYPENFSVFEFVSYCAWLRELPSKRIPEATAQALERTGLTEKAKTPLRKLSGGMLRRAGIAQAIVGEPALIIFDEPTTGLDPRQRSDFRNLVRDLSRTSSVVLSTHLAEDASLTCTGIGVQHQGELLFRGTVAELEDRAKPGTAGDTEFERGYTSVIEGKN